MTRYTSLTDTDQREMLETIGVSSIEDLFGDIPSPLRLDRPLALRCGPVGAGGARRAPGLGRQERLDRGRAFVPRRGHVRPLHPGADRLDHRAVRVPDSLHAVSARDLAGRPAGDVRVPDRDLRAHRSADLQRFGVRGPERRRGRRLRRQAGQRPPPVRRLARRPSAFARGAGDARARMGNGDRRGAASRRRHRVARARRGRQRGCRRSSPTSSARSRTSSAIARAAHDVGCADDLLVRPAAAGAAQDARRVRRRHRRRRGPVARQPARLRRPVVRVLRRHRGADPPDARPHRGRDARRGRQARASC